MTVLKDTVGARDYAGNAHESQYRFPDPLGFSARGTDQKCRNQDGNLFQGTKPSPI
jgi:hypothetical protein